MSVSLADVARYAGVSVATASRVISGSSYHVSEQLRERVLTAVDELGYKPNALARALVSRQTKTLGVIVGDVTDPYFAEIARGVEDYARPFGYLTIVCNADRNLSVELAYLEMLQEHHAEGIIFAGGMFTGLHESETLRDAVSQAIERDTRVLTLGERPFENVPTITVDNPAMLYDLTSYLIQLGHRRIAFVQGPRDFTTADLRMEGYLEACTRAGLDPMVYPGGFTYEDGRTATMRILRDPLPDAIIGTTDESAIGILMTLRQAGIQVPDQVSVAGVDNIRYAEVVDLTSVEVPMYEWGAMAGRLIISEERDALPSRTVLPHRLVSRGTTARHRR